MIQSYNLSLLFHTTYFKLKEFVNPTIKKEEMIKNEIHWQSLTKLTKQILDADVTFLLQHFHGQPAPPKRLSLILLIKTLGVHDQH